MTIKSQGGIFGRNPTFNDVEVDNDVEVNGQLGVRTSSHWDASTGITAAGRIHTSNGTATGGFNYGGGTVINMGSMSSHPVQMIVGNSTKAIFETGGDLKIVSGNLVIGTSGKGIDFSATSGTGTSELFDDYEEGTFTVTDTSGAGLTFTQEHGFYTKVGRLVHCHIFVQYPSTANGSNAKLGGFPFTSASLGASMGGAWGYTNGTGAVSFTIGQGATDIGINNSSGGSLTNANMSGSFNYITVTYQAA